MKYSLLEKLDSSAVSRIIAELKEAEASRDIERAIEGFAPLWSNIDEDPDFSDFDFPQQAILYRLSGFFLSIYGNVRSLKNYQERAKDLLFKGIDIFNLMNDKFGLADAQNILALCYYSEGAILEGETILEQTAHLLEGNELHPVYLRNRLNFIQAKIKRKEFQEALKIIEQIRIPMEFCDDYRACAIFHEKAGITYNSIRQYDQAVWHYHESIRFADKLNNLLFISTERNNLAFLYNKIRNFELAHENINEAIRLARENNFVGWLPLYLDTQALIFANEGNLELALETIEEAIEIYRNGDDYYGLTESIWNKCHFLLLINRKEEAILQFNELIPIAAQKMGEFAVKNFIKEFAKLIHIKRDGSLDEEVRRFKRTEIVNAILQANYNLHQAAEYLKTDLTLLTKTLDKEFPELYDELDLLHPPKSDPNFEIVENKPTTLRKINELRMDSSNFVFETETPLQFKTFYFSAEKMSEAFGIRQDAVVVILPADKILADEFILIKDLSRNLYSFGKVNYDKSLDIYYLFESDFPIPISTNEFTLIGKAFAFCPFEEIDNEKLLFRLLNV